MPGRFVAFPGSIAARVPVLHYVAGMALQQLRTDDLTGKPDASTVVITVNGDGVEIDLDATSVKALTKALGPYWAAGSPATFDVVKRVGKRSTSKRDDGRGYDLAELRAWAARSGIELSTRGRVPQALVDQYLRER